MSETWWRRARTLAATGLWVCLGGCGGSPPRAVVAPGPYSVLAGAPGNFYAFHGVRLGWDLAPGWHGQRDGSFEWFSSLADPSLVVVVQSVGGCSLAGARRNPELAEGRSRGQAAPALGGFDRVLSLRELVFAQREVSVELTAGVRARRSQGSGLLAFRRERVEFELYCLETELGTSLVMFSEPSAKPETRTQWREMLRSLRVQHTEP